MYTSNCYTDPGIDVINMHKHSSHHLITLKAPKNDFFLKTFFLFLLKGECSVFNFFFYYG